MPKKMLLVGIFIGTLIGLLLATAGIALAGGLNPSAGPDGAASQMYTLEQIYQRLTSGDAGTKQTAFSEPAAGPGTSTMHTLDQIMSAAPAVDATNGAIPANVASGKTFWGLTAGKWGLQTGTATIPLYPALVPKTGLSASYYPEGNDDGTLQKGVAWPSSRFTDNSNGTVTDNLTGLVWSKNANCFGSQDWQTALSSAKNLASGSCGLTDGSTVGDWRMPNAREIQSLVDYSLVYPALANKVLFTGVGFGEVIWTSTPYSVGPEKTWALDFQTGTLAVVNMSSVHFTWPVRDAK